MPLVDQLAHARSDDNFFISAVRALTSGDVELALQQAKQLIQRDSGDPYALVLAADCFNSYGKEEEGLGLIRAAVSASGSAAVFSLLHSQQLLRLKRHDQSLDCLNKARLLHPSHSGLLWMQFELLCSLNKDAEAQDLVDSERSQLVSHSGFYPLVIALYRRVGEHQKALVEAQQWCQKVKSGDSLKALADCWFSVGCHDQYVSSMIEAANCSDQDPNLLALSLQAQLDASSEAIPAVLSEIEALIGCDSIDPGLALVCSRVLLAHSDFSRGWKLYERRLMLFPSGLYAPVETVSDPLCSLEGQTVLLVAEQGVGDVIFFARFIPQLLAEAHQVIFLVDERLSALFKRCCPDIVVATSLRLAQQLAGDGHMCLAIGSLPLRYASTPQLVYSSQQCPVFEPHPMLKRAWASSFSAAPFNVGLSLTAGLQLGSYKTLKRSVPVSVVERAIVDSFALIHDLRHFRPVELALPNVVSYDQLTDDLEQLIAFISCLDILVTSDQTNAFLAGMLGIPTLLIAPPNPHFAFMAEGDSTPWFSSLTIVRSQKWRCWDEVVGEFETRFRVLLNPVVRG